MKYKCLVLDHDDTVVNSTPEIHYPAYVQIMSVLRPDKDVLSLHNWMKINFDPGLMHYFVEDLKLTEEELERQFSMWREFISTRTPHFFEGISEIIQKFKNKGGIVAVVSHSEQKYIERDYNSLPFDLKPDIIFGWDHDEEKRKPGTYPIIKILNNFKLEAKDLLVVDDLKPGIKMALDSNVDTAAALWAHQIPEIIEYMKSECTYLLESVEELNSILF
jgi:pyrophosphatase PpaX